MKRIKKKIVLRSENEFDSVWDYLRHLDALRRELLAFLAILTSKIEELETKKTGGLSWLLL